MWEHIIQFHGYLPHAAVPAIETQSETQYHIYKSQSYLKTTARHSGLTQLILCLQLVSLLFKCVHSQREREDWFTYSYYNAGEIIISLGNEWFVLEQLFRNYLPLGIHVLIYILWCNSVTMSGHVGIMMLLWPPNEQLSRRIILYSTSQSSWHLSCFKLGYGWLESAHVLW